MIASVIQARDVKRREHVRRFSRQSAVCLRCRRYIGHLYVPSPCLSQMSRIRWNGRPHQKFREPFLNMKGAIATRRLQVTTARHAFVTLNSEA